MLYIEHWREMQEAPLTVSWVPFNSTEIGPILTSNVYSPILRLLNVGPEAEIHGVHGCSDNHHMLATSTYVAISGVGNRVGNATWDVQYLAFWLYVSPIFCYKGITSTPWVLMLSLHNAGSHDVTKNCCQCRGISMLQIPSLATDNVNF